MESSESTKKSGISYLPLEAIFTWATNKDFIEFILSQTDDEQQIISSTKETKAPEMFKRDLFTCICESINGLRLFPSFEAGEKVTNTYMSMILSKCLIKLNSCSKRKLALNLNRSFKWANESLNLNGIVGQTVTTPKSFVLPDMCVVNDNKKVVMVFELKKDSVDNCFKQCVIYLKLSFIENADDNPVYGAASNGLDISFLKYDCNGFKILDKISLIKPRMVDVNFCDNWVKNHSRSIDILYSILYVVSN